MSPSPRRGAQFPCPLCKTDIAVTLEDLLSRRSFTCPGCGLVLGMALKSTEPAAGARAKQKAPRRKKAKAAAKGKATRARPLICMPIAKLMKQPIAVPAIKHSKTR